jgi:hypothetical protein
MARLWVEHSNGKQIAKGLQWSLLLEGPERFGSAEDCR